MNKQELLEEVKKKGIMLEYGRDYKNKELIEMLAPNYQPNYLPAAPHSLEAAAKILDPEEQKIDSASAPTAAILTPKQSDMEKLMGMVGGIVSKLEDIDTRVKKMEQPTGNEYRMEAKQQDIDDAAVNKKNLDPKIVEIVESSLGVDFGIEVEPRGDQPGFLFTVVVPRRLSDLKEDERPVKMEDGSYKKTAEGSTVMERYFPQDRRSRAIGSSQSYDAIREHCDRVRSFIVAYYQKVKKPLPEFKVK